MRYSRVTIALVVLGCLLAPAPAQLRHREPLTQEEIDQLRDAAMDPYARLKLFTHFARVRLVSVEEMRNDPKITDRSERTHDRLQEFVDIYDELNENIDNFIERKEDMRRPLKAVIEADSDFHRKLLALKDAAAAGPKDAEPYRFLLDNALGAVETGVEDHKQLLAEQETKHNRKSK
jgi:hypothetical protein